MGTNLSCDQRILCDRLFDIGAIKFGNFKLKLHGKYPEAPLSPIYCDLRVVQRYPEVKKLAVSIYCGLLEDLEYDVLAGIPVAATPFTSSISDALNIGMITPRMEEKSHGTGAKVDGITEDESYTVAVIIDDLITKADSKLEAAEILRSSGFAVHVIVVLIDRSQDSVLDKLAEAKLTLHAAITLDQMLEYYLETGRIDNDIYNDTLYKLNLLNNYQ